MTEDFPLIRPTIDEHVNDRIDLNNLDAKSLFKRGKWSTRYEYKYKLTDYYVDISRVGSKASNYFHHNARMCCDSLNSPSPIRSWFNPKIKQGLYNCKIANGNMKTAIAMRKYIASQFRPSAAKCLYDIFKAKHIFDPCMGWGDRLEGFLSSSAETYTGLDVNPHLFLNYLEQIKDSSKADKVGLILERAEKYRGDQKYDFIFTSPPYYDIERYDGVWQSHKSYNKFDSWLKNFLFKMVRNAWDMLEDGGHLAINISDVYSHHTVNKICDPMCDFISKLPQAKYKGCIGYRMMKRPNSKASGDIFCEPIWVFKKVVG